MFLITGYPKTGNTWLHVMISYVMNPNKMIDGTAEPPLSSMFSHCMPNFNRESYKHMSILIPGTLDDKSVLLLVRHPGDTLVSLYMHNVYRERFPMYDGTLDEMVYDNIYGIHKFLVYYEWWWKYRDVPKNICIVRYEDLSTHPYDTFSQALYAMKMYIPAQTVRNAVRFGSFENMQQLEKTNHLDWPTLYRPHRKIQKALKVRKGKIGLYKELLKPETVSYIDRHVKTSLHSCYGYLS